jgi:hypothetical protein
MSFDSLTNARRKMRDFPPDDPLRGSEIEELATLHCQLSQSLKTLMEVEIIDKLKFCYPHKGDPELQAAGRGPRCISSAHRIEMDRHRGRRHCHKTH